MADDYYVQAYEDFRSMGLEGAATQMLLQGLRASNSSKLRELAQRDGIQLPEVGQEGYYQSSNEVLFQVPVAKAEDGDEALKAFLDAQERHQDFVEASLEAWQLQRGKNWQELKQQEEQLRHAAREAFDRCKELLMRRAVTMRPELLRAPITPDALPETQMALSQGGDPEGALRKLLGDAAGAFQDPDLWSKEGPGRLLEQSQRMAELDALPARAKELAQTGPGSLPSLLSAIAVETSAAAKGCKDVLVLGGQGVSAVAAVRAMEAPGKVVIWEPLEDVAHAACEVLKRNLGPDELARCRVVSSCDPPPHLGGLVVLDRWHGLGVLGWSPLLALRRVLAASAAPSGVVPSRLSISLALADAGLGETQGLDLSAMDARFRGLATGPLRVGVGEQPHATSLQPKILTDFVQAFDYDLACPSLALDGPKSLAFSARPSKVAANACVFECRFELPRSKGPASLRFAQWIPGGLQLAGAESKLCAWRNDSRVWLEWDGAKSLYPPFGFMALSEWYFEMLRDDARHELYVKALQVEIAKVKETRPECKVLDVGSGDGILSLMALRAGATYGLGVEYVTQIARASEEVIAANRAARKVPIETPLEIWCTDVRGIGERESEAERFEVLVTELMDASGLGENLILLTEGSKRRLCKDTSSVIPAKLRLKAVLCEVKLPEINGVNIDAFWPFWPLDRTGDALWLGVDLDKREGDFKVLTDPVELLSLRLGEADVDAIPSRASFNFKGTNSGTANMVVWWFEAQLSETDPSVVLTNAPTFLDGRHAATCWGQAAAEIAHTQVLKGESTEILMEMTFGDYQLKFKTPSAGDARFGRFAPPPHVEDYSAEYQQVLKDYAVRQQSYLSFAKESRVGHSAIRSADVESVAALQRCALAMALFPGSFGLEGTTANRVLVSWYTVGGEGRS